MENFNKQVEKMSIATLEDGHRDAFIRALTNVLSSQIAEITYGQIVDGLPLSSVARDVYSDNVCSGHPLLNEHKELCPGVVEHLRRLGTNFDAGALKIQSQVGAFQPDFKFPLELSSSLLMSSDRPTLQLIHDFQSAFPGSSEFNTRLIELVARAVHQLAVWLYRQDTSWHKNDALGLWRPSEESGRFYPRTFPATLLRHAWYCDYDQYPDGIADCVGYWAEARILGGVALFDRRNPGSVPDATVSTGTAR
jgi:hypothetical protein